MRVQINKRTHLDGQAVSEQGEEPRKADGGEVDTELREVRVQLRRELLHEVEQYERARARR